MDLPIDHFRLLGVSPSADPASILRRLQTRSDSPPDDGFTHEGLLQRQALLRQAADLLTDPGARADYEAALLSLSSSHPNETVGLDLAASSEVAGLILLWEAGAAYEAFQLARQGLQPPQAPALGSGREADLTLLAALACRDASRDEQQQRRYESAAQLLREGIELQQRMGKLPDQQAGLQQELDDLLPYRVLDLLSRDLSDAEARQQGISLLDGLVRDRGGLDPEGLNADPPAAAMGQADFESFFQQIRRFLTVQEQIDLFRGWFAEGSIEAGCLAVFALAAAGYSRRKPEFLEQARDQLQQLAASDLDPMPLLGCLDLLLGNVSDASLHFSAIRDQELLRWLAEHPGDHLAAQCEYCRVWLERDVLPGYRDVDATGVDLDAWFADRDVQAYVDRIDRQTARQDVAAIETNAGLETWALADASSLQAAELDNVPSMAEEVQSADAASTGSPRRLRLLVASAVVGLVAALAAAVMLRPRATAPVARQPQPELQDATESKSSSSDPANLSPAATLQPEASTGRGQLEPLLSDAPDEAQLRLLVQGWLDNKALALQGQASMLPVVARQRLIDQVDQERAAAVAAGNTTVVKASVTSLEVVSRQPRRIELKAEVAYSDSTTDRSGSVVDRTEPGSLTITYILGRDGDQWRLTAYIPQG
ncbi:MAG: DUF4101 domain-containing protein [Synechococcus sp. MED-G133]|uniref:IMS domain-containing protein n=1 Tax=Synechococcus sp. A15-28 TaxID=1050638 RepID=UPI0011F74D62|nr:IMS domain-containing protein [Synechococcus sp. A15-28]MBA4732987.1 ARC6/PARC6 family protein [Synechococcus sp.]QNI42769.1 cell division protein ZipN [Synechococcus sp. A15-28]RZO07662.1 MAG: DUF4101 domain-containing protein [Synechococcus sp. MED-G133]